MIDAETNFDFVHRGATEFENLASRKFFLFQPEEISRQNARNVYDRLEEAKRLVRTLPGASVKSYGIYPVGDENCFDEFLPIFADRDWQTRSGLEIVDYLFLNRELKLV